MQTNTDLGMLNERTIVGHIQERDGSDCLFFVFDFEREMCKDRDGSLKIQ